MNKIQRQEDTAEPMPSITGGNLDILPRLKISFQNHGNQTPGMNRMRHSTASSNQRQSLLFSLIIAFLAFFFRNEIYFLLRRSLINISRVTTCAVCFSSIPQFLPHTAFFWVKCWYDSKIFMGIFPCNYMIYCRYSGQKN